MLHAMPGRSCAELGFSSPVARSTLVSKCRCLIRFSLSWEKQPTLEIKPLCWPEERVRELPGAPRLPPLLPGLPNLPGKAKPPTHGGHRTPVHILYSPVGARGPLWAC